MLKVLADWVPVPCFSGARSTGFVLDFVCVYIYKRTFVAVSIGNFLRDDEHLQLHLVTKQQKCFQLFGKVTTTSRQDQ